MKKRANWLLIPAVVLGLGACDKKQAAKAPAAPPTRVDAPSPPVVEAKAVPLSAGHRAAKLGFAQHLPQDTEVALAFYNGTKTVDRVKASKLWKLIGGPVGGGAISVEEPDSADLFGSEFTLALGKSTAEQTANLLTLNRRLSCFQMRGLVKAFAATMKSGDASALGESFADRYGKDLMIELIKDPQSGITLLERAKMPPVYLAFRTNEADRAAAAQQLAAMLSNINMLGEMVEPVMVENSGHKFEGVKILGSKISATIAEDRKILDGNFGVEMVDRLLAALAKKDLVVVSGTVGDYVLLFVGGSAGDLKLATDLDHSMVASDALAFSDAYATKELAALVYGQKEAMDTLITGIGGLADMTNGLRDGIAGADGLLGDTRDLEAMFQIVGEREAALRKLAGIDAVCTVAFFEDGLKIESAGGSDNGMVDWKSPNQLAHLGDSDDVVLFADMTTDAAYDEKARAYAEALLETAYAMTMKVAEAPMKSEQLTQFKAMATMFDGKFRPDMLALWDAYGHDFHRSLGHERALVVDLKGSAPAIPGLPQAVVDSAKVPRVSLIAPVTDRAKLAASWDKMNSTLTGTFAKISELTGNEIPMQKPISSEKDGNTTWFFPMPFFTDDFLPSVTVGDKWFAASTSKNQALDLINRAAAGGKTRDGFWLSMNFKALEKYSKETSKLVDENAEALTGSPLAEDKKKLIQNSIEILGDLDKLTIHARRESAVLRTSVHFKTR